MYSLAEFPSTANKETYMTTLNDIDQSQISSKYRHACVDITTDFIYNSRLAGYMLDAISGSNSTLIDYSKTIDDNGQALVDALDYGQTKDLYPAIHNFCTDAKKIDLSSITVDEANAILAQNNAKIQALNELRTNNKLLHEINNL